MHYGLSPVRNQKLRKTHLLLLDSDFFRQKYLVKLRNFQVVGANLSFYVIFDCSNESLNLSFHFWDFWFSTRSSVKETASSASCLDSPPLLADVSQRDFDAFFPWCRWEYIGHKFSSNWPFFGLKSFCTFCLFQFLVSISSVSISGKILSGSSYSETLHLLHSSTLSILPMGLVYGDFKIHDCPTRSSWLWALSLLQSEHQQAGLSSNQELTRSSALTPFQMSRQLQLPSRLHPR